MFASSPQHRSGFITPEMSEHLALLLKKSGCRSVHIGGGEPFMNFSALCSLIEKLAENGISIDYIETNASWCKSEDFVRTRLKKLRELGVDTVMASVDPFHIEFVPLERPLLLCRILREEGFDYFICKERYLRKLFKLDHDRTYSREELCEILGDDYIADTASDYGLGMNGRALAIAPKLYRKRPIEQLLTRGKCESLEIPQHCHFDLDGNAVPSGCPGLVCSAEDYLNDNFPRDKYPVFSRLASGGLKSLYAHLSVASVRVGDYIQKGHSIGIVGNTGFCTGTTLHFGLYVFNVPVRYYNYESDGVSLADPVAEALGLLKKTDGA